MSTRKLAAETAIMYTAQQLVDRWLRSHNRGPFSRAVARAEELEWDADPTKDEHRRAFRRVADAIRLGKGHAFQNPAPLLRIMRDTVRQGAGLIPNGGQSASIPHPH
jgi:hypothetical protein